jgi:hypothetical protein
MAEFDRPRYSKRQIVDAGKLLSGSIQILNDEVLEAFRIAHNWRAACALPMHMVRAELRGKVVRGGCKGLTAGRLKRMDSIRRKLAKTPLNLYQIQDIAGVRAILPSMLDVERVASYFSPGNTSHKIVREDDYIVNPKADGYRCRHIVLKFQGGTEWADFDRQFVEIQLRTELQHCWATAVEAVGLVRNENLKAGEGSPEWRRFFALMSAEIAAREGQPVGPHVPQEANDRVTELRSLNRTLNAVQELEGYKQGIKYAEELAASGLGYFVISFNPSTREVIVNPFSQFRESSISYDRGDAIALPSNRVLVEVDRVRDLKAAYPNYFLDVDAFLAQCHRTLNPAQPEPDYSWVASWRRPRKAP